MYCKLLVNALIGPYCKELPYALMSTGLMYLNIHICHDKVAI